MGPENRSEPDRVGLGGIIAITRSLWQRYDAWSEALIEW